MGEAKRVALYRASVCTGRQVADELDQRERVPGSVGRSAPGLESIELRHRCAFPREDVFEAWTHPAALARWFGGRAARVLSAAVDLRTGGAYRITMLVRGRVLAVEGVYEEIVAPRRLVYTWHWDLAGCTPARVNVDFLDRDGDTEIVLTHEEIPKELAGVLA